MQMIEGTDMEGDDCATIVMKAHKAGNQGLFNNAAQSWNHEFYWKCMKKVSYWNRFSLGSNWV